MKKTKKIMACVDFSDYSQMTLETAVELARALDAQILLLNVLNQQYTLDAAAGFYPPQTMSANVTGEMIEDRYQTLRKLVRDHFPEDKSRITMKVEVGRPSEVILDMAEAEDMDLIVIANKGRSNLSRVLFGSVAEKVQRHSKITVVSVRDREKFKRSSLYSI